MSKRLQKLDRRQALAGLGTLLAGVPLFAAGDVQALVPSAPPSVAKLLGHSTADSSGTRSVVGAPSATPQQTAVVEALGDLGSKAPAGPANMFAPVRVGDEVGLGWKLTKLRAPDRGAMLIELEKGVNTARVHVCSHEGSPVGPARTEQLDFVIMNNGKGSRATNEEVGRVVLTLASLAATTGIVPTGLLTHEQRLDAWALSPEPGTLT